MGQRERERLDRSIQDPSCPNNPQREKEPEPVTVTYRTDDDDETVIGTCSKHGEFVGDAIGCPACFAECEEAEARHQDALEDEERRKKNGVEEK
jgi:hypothetical protein